MTPAAATTLRSRAPRNPHRRRRPTRPVPVPASAPSPAPPAPFPTPRNPAELHAFLRRTLDLTIPRTPLLPTSSAPFDYLVHTFFEGRFTRTSSSPPSSPRRSAARSLPPQDSTLWANRGGGKTFLGAVATMLDLVFKPGIQVRILGGSLEQSRRMYAHLRALFDRDQLRDLVDGRITEKRLTLTNKSTAEILAQSETAVRGTRVQKVRCDEVELFSPEIWSAAQLTTRSMRLPGPWGQWVRGAVEALSTMHKPYGLMWDIVGQSVQVGRDEGTEAQRHSVEEEDPKHAKSRVLFRWGLIDSLATCGPEHACDSCALWDDCQGRAKPGYVLDEPRPTPLTISASPTQRLRASVPLSLPPRGHIPISDALAMKARVDSETWQSEMLCLRPRRSHCVFPEFDPDIHCYGEADPPSPRNEAGEKISASPISPSPRSYPAGKLVCGMDFGFRAPTVILWASHGEDGVLRIFDEYVRTGVRLEEHIAQITAGDSRPGLRGWPAPTWLAPDPACRAPNHQTGLADLQFLRSAGLSLRVRAHKVPEGLRLIRTRLAPAAGAPTLLIHRRCATLIESLTRYHYDENRPESLDPVKDGPDHAVDALRYLVVGVDRPFKTVHR